MVSRVALNFGNNSELQLFHISTVISELSCNSVLLSGANFTPFMCSNWRSFHSQLSLLAQCCCFQKGFSSVFLGRLLLSSCLLLVSLSQQRWFGQVFYQHYYYQLHGGVSQQTPVLLSCCWRNFPLKNGLEAEPTLPDQLTCTVDFSFSSQLRHQHHTLSFPACKARLSAPDCTTAAPLCFL